MLRHPHDMSEEGETSPLDDGGQRQGAGPPLNLHVGDEVKPPDAAKSKTGREKFRNNNIMVAIVKNGVCDKVHSLTNVYIKFLRI